MLAGRARRGVGWSVTSLSGTALLSLLQLAVAARFLSPGDFGLMALILVVSSLASGLSDLGTANAVLHRQSATGPELTSLFWLNVATGCGLAALVAVAGPLLALAWDEPALGRWMPVMALAFLPIGVGQLPITLLRRELRFRALGLGELVAALASLAVVALLAVGGAGVAALVAGQLVGALLRALAALWSSRDLFRPSLHFASDDVRPFVSFGAYQLGERVVNYASWNLDKLVIGGWLGVEALGLYSLAYQLTLRPFRLITAVSTRVTSPLLARLQADRTRLAEGFLTGVRLIAFLAFPLYVGAFLVAEPLVTLIYGEGWREVAVLFSVLWPLGILYAVGNPLGALVVATGNARAGLRWQVFAAGVHLVAVLVGAAHGARGVAIALVAANLAVLFPASFYLRWVLVRLPPAPFLACLAPPLVYAALMGVVVLGIAPGVASLPPTLQVASAAACGALVYGALLWVRERPLLAVLRGT